MHHPHTRIAGKPTDYQYCPNCTGFNWYEREFCVHCESPLKGKAIPKKVLKDLTANLQECPEQIDVESEV